VLECDQVGRRKNHKKLPVFFVPTYGFYIEIGEPQSDYHMM